MAKIYIDGKEYEVDARNNLLQECLSEGLDLPYFCWHPSMGSVGACRQCAMIEYSGEEDQTGRIIMGCMTAPRDGGRYSIKNAYHFRSNVIESLMTSHPHDCPVCEEGGECHLQDMTVMSGHTYRRYRGSKVTYRNQDLGPFIGHEMNRCITCYRCVRFYQDYAGGTDLTDMACHNHIYFGRYEEGPLESEFSGNLAEVCPTGVFTDKPFSKRYTRKWDLQTAPSICPGCSVGCNINPGERYGTLRRVVNRYNDDVNGYFICDRGRFGAGYVNSEERIPVSMTRDSHEADPVFASHDEARRRLHDMAAGGAIGIGSPRASMEANFALRELVGEENFYAGVAEEDFALLTRIIDIYENAPVNAAHIRDIEHSDAVLILGEDVTNTAARLSLALRQSVRNKAFDMAREKDFPLWHDAAIRELAQDARSPLYILSPHATRLDDVARQVHIADAGQSARIGFAVAHAIDPEAPAVSGLSDEEQALADAIAGDLKNARRPLVIAGTGSRSLALVNAAGNIAAALADGRNKTNLALVPDERNSLGLALMMQNNRGKTLDAAMASGAKSAIVLENDLYRRAPTAEVDRFIGGLDRLAVLDSLKHHTGEQANLVLAAGTFAETSGTYVNYETRAQHYYSVFVPDENIRSSTSWLSDLKLPELTEACARSVEHCGELTHLSPGPGYNVAGLKAPRQPYRYSGRTAMNAHVSVHEPRPPADEEGVMTYSMEGVPPLKDASVFSSPWAPGWNSNQSVFKFQDEVAGSLKQASHGERLIKNKGRDKHYADPDIPSGGAGEGLRVFPLYHIFGSEEQSALTPAIAQRATCGYVALSPADAEKLGLATGDGVTVEGNGAVPCLVRESLRPGTVGVTVGLRGLNYLDLPASVSVGKSESWQAPDDWHDGNIIISDKRAC